MNISAGGGGKWVKGSIKVPGTGGAWKTTEGVEVELQKGRKTVWMSSPGGFTLRWIELKLKASQPAAEKPKPKPKPATKSPEKKAEGMLKLAKMYLGVGKKAKAIEILKGIVADYLGTDAAKAAARKLKEL